MVSLLDRSAGFECVVCALDDHVATITLNRPERRNALNYRAYDELEQAFRAATADPEVRCVIVTGTDPAFCSGDDVGVTAANFDHAANHFVYQGGADFHFVVVLSSAKPADAA